MNKARAICAAALMLLATVAVLSVINQESDFVKINNSVLTHEEEQAAKKAGNEAAVESEVNEKADENALHTAKEQDREELEREVMEDKIKAMDKDHYGSNCLALKAYARASYDKLLDTRKGSVNVLREILETLGAPGVEDKYNKPKECKAKLDEVFNKLENDKRWAHIPMGGSIAKSMTKTVIDQMKNKHGILVWAKLKDRSCLHASHRDCVHEQDKKNGGQWVLLDANRVGWSGEPPIFYKLAVRATTVIRLAREMISKEDMHKITIVKNKKENVKFLSPKIFKQLKKWDGKLQS